jgi:hypothetical protein
MCYVTIHSFIHSFATTDIDEPASPSDLVVLRALYPDCLDNSHAAQSTAQLGHASASQQSPMPAVRSHARPIHRKPTRPVCPAPPSVVVPNDPAAPSSIDASARAVNPQAQTESGDNKAACRGGDDQGEGKENLSQGGSSQGKVTASETALQEARGRAVSVDDDNNRNKSAPPAKDVGLDAGDQTTDTDHLMLDGAAATPASEPRVDPARVGPNTERKNGSSVLWQSPVSHLYCAQDDAATASETKHKHARLVKVLNVLLPVWLARSSDRVACRMEWKQAQDALLEFEQLRQARNNGSIAAAGTMAANAVAMRFLVGQR